jgi:hypothetical protein
MCLARIAYTLWIIFIFVKHFLLVEIHQNVVVVKYQIFVIEYNNDVILKSVHGQSFYSTKILYYQVHIRITKVICAYD